MDELAGGLAESLSIGLEGRTISSSVDINTTELRKRQTNAFRPGTRAGVEHDFVFKVSTENKDDRELKKLIEYA